MRALPRGTLTFLFTDIEGSTQLLHEVGARYGDMLLEHRRKLRAAFARHGGTEIDTAGDAFFVAFGSAADAVAAAAEAQEALSGGPIKVRMGVHSGEADVVDGTYVGLEVHRAARVAAAAHGGQVVLSEATRELVTAETRDLGEHRLKDLLAPERLYQLGDDEFPPLRSLYQTNLPIPATPFLGREQEVAEIVELLSDGRRLVTLTGAGGTGKTRLGLQAAAGAADAYDGGVWWVPLAALQDPELVLATAAEAIGAKTDLAEAIVDRRLLLLFDNFEHLLEAGPRLGTLLAACPRLTVLATSREPLRIDGEHEYPVEPLREAEAVDLFVERARGIARQVELDGVVSEICRRLDYLPLAVELAAARTRILSPEAILERLGRRLPLLTGGARDAPERQRTLAATIRWSHDLLSAGEQRLFARLSVFRGGCTLAAAETVCDADLDLLQSLVEKSLVRFTQDRFWMLETIREFAAVQLAASGEQLALGARHAEFFTSLAVEAEPQLRSRELFVWFDRLRAEHDNVRAALDLLEAGDDACAHGRLAGACWYFWYVGGHFREGLRRLGAAFARADAVSAEERAVLHDGLSTLHSVVGEVAEGLAHADSSLAIRRGANEPSGLLRSLLNRAGLASVMGNAEESKALYRECADLALAAGDDWFRAVALGNLGAVLHLEHEYERARSLETESVALLEEIGDPLSLRAITINLGASEVELGDYASAARRIGGAARDSLDGRAPELLVWALVGLVFIEAEAGDPERGARLVGATEAVADRISYMLRSNQLERYERAIAELRRRLGEADFDRARAAGRKLSDADAIAYAVAPDGAT